MNDLSIISASNLPTLTDAEMATYAGELVLAHVENGGDIVTLTGLAAKLERLAGYLKVHAKEAALNEVRAYGKEGITKAGVSMLVKEVGVSYDYSTDPVWQGLQQAVNTATDLRKAHETRLKALPPAGRFWIDEETGEEYLAYPPIRKGGEGVVLTIH